MKVDMPLNKEAKTEVKIMIMIFYSALFKNKNDIGLGNIEYFRTEPFHEKFSRF